MLRSTMLILGGALITAPLYAQAAPATQEMPQATASVTGGVVAGAKVKDASGADVGTIESVSGDVATLSTGTTKAGIPVASFASNADGTLGLGLTKAQVDAQASTATRTAAATPAAPQFDVGAKVSDASGAQVGTVKAVKGENVTVASSTAAAQLPKSAFASGPDGLVIGLSPAQFEAAAKAAGGKTG